jgi:hypothetical protein
MPSNVLTAWSDVLTPAERAGKRLPLKLKWVPGGSRCKFKIANVVSEP